MFFFANSIILLILDSFLLLLCFSVFVCVWMVFMFFIFVNNTIRINNNFVFLDFISSNYLDLYWFLLGSFFISALLLRLSLLLYYSWLSLLVFDLCRVVAFQWYWIFFLFNDSVIFSNLLVESDYFVGDLRLLQCNNNFTLLSLVIYKLWLTSIDVIHSFTISSLGINVDCIPGSCTELAIVSNISGTFYGQCSELCGVLHGFMPIVITFI